MKATICGFVLPALLFSATEPSFAADNAAQDTITLKRVVLSPNTGIAGLGDVEVSFENDGPVAARRVEFLVTKLDGGTTKLEDVGEFSKGTTFTHDLRVSSLSDGARVNIDQIVYDDGSVWTAPGPRSQER